MKTQRQTEAETWSTLISNNPVSPWLFLPGPQHYPGRYYLHRKGEAAPSLPQGNRQPLLRVPHSFGQGEWVQCRRQGPGQPHLQQFRLRLFSAIYPSQGPVPPAALSQLWAVLLSPSLPTSSSFHTVLILLLSLPSQHSQLVLFKAALSTHALHFGTQGEPTCLAGTSPHLSTSPSRIFSYYCVSTHRACHFCLSKALHSRHHTDHASN